MIGSRPARGAYVSTAIALALVLGLVSARALDSQAYAQVRSIPQIYMLSGVGDLLAMNPDGTARRTLLKELNSDGTANFFEIQDLEADARRIYWLDQDRIGAISLDGTQVNGFAHPLVDLQGLGFVPTAFAVDDRYFYFAWTAGNTVGIGRANLDGSDIDPNLVDSSVLSAGRPLGSGFGEISSVAVDGARVYWADARTGRIGRARLDGSDAQPAFITHVMTSARPSIAVAVGGGHVYWSYATASNGTETAVGRARLDGSDVEQPFRRVYGGGDSLAIDRDHIYWGQKTNGFIGRMNVDGSDVFGCFHPCGPADGAVGYPIAVAPTAPPKPSRRCSLNQTSVRWGRTLVASCRGLSGRITISVASTTAPAAASPSGLLVTQLRFSRSLRHGRLTIGTKKFCRDRFRTSRYRIFLTRNGAQEVGTATVRLTSQKTMQNCDEPRDDT